MTNSSGSTKVAYFGPQTTNTHAAALEIFGAGATYEPFATIPAVFDAVASGAMTHGVVPIENSTEGTIRETVDCLLTKSPVIFLEHEMAIRHCLMGLPGVPPEARAFIVSHPQPLAQCRQWLDTHYPNIPRRAAASTAFAAKEAAADSTLLAVATELAANTHNLQIFSRGIADRAHNATRFVGISKADGAPTGNDKTSLVLATPHVRGALRGVLGILDDANVSLSRIESRPLPDRAWEYAFVIDVEGHRLDDHVASALRVLTEKNHLLRILGSYPKCRSTSG